MHFRLLRRCELLAIRLDERVFVNVLSSGLSSGLASVFTAEDDANSFDDDNDVSP